MEKEKERIVFIAIVLIITAAVLWTVNYKTHFNGFFWNDSHDYNQIARNIYEGNGFKTSVLRPVNFLHFKQLPHPEVSRPPLYPHLLAGFFMLFGVNDFAVAFCDGVFYVALVVLTFIVAMELSNSYKIALFSAATVALSKYFLIMSIIGSSDIVYSAVFAIFLLFYLKKQKLYFRHGILIGILYLFRVNTIFFVIPLLLMEFKPREFLTRRRDLLKLAAGAFVVITPYLIRNYIATGNPLFSLHKYSLVLQTKTYPGWTLWIQLKDISALQFIVNHSDEMLQKVISSARFLCADFTNVFHPLVLIALALALVFPIVKNDRIKKLRKLVIWTAILQTLATLPVGPEARFYLYLFPVIFMLFGIAAYEPLKSVKMKEQLLSAVLIVMFIALAYPTASYLRSGKNTIIYPYIGEKLMESTRPDDIIASDIAWEISWYADRKTVWLPYDIETMNAISESMPIKYVFLSINLSRPLASYRDDLWQRLFFNAGYLNLPDLKLTNVIYFGNSPIGVLYKVERGQEQS